MVAKVFHKPASYEPLAEQSIKLVVTPIGPHLPRKFQAYHTSVLVDDQELSFSMMGIGTARGPESHLSLPRSVETVIKDMGKVRSVDVASLKAKLRPYFRRDSYDLLRKNCNSFSHVCLSILVGTGLDGEYRYLEGAAIAMDRHMGLVQRLSRGNYVPNPKAGAFAVEEVVAKFLDTEPK